MKNFRKFCLEKQLVSRQYNDKWKFVDYNEVIKRLQCNYVLSFRNCPIPSDLQDGYEVPVSSCKFSNKQNDILAVSNENGIVCIENVKKIQTLKYVQTHKNTVYDIAWVPGNSQFVTVSGDNSAKLWDCNESTVSLMSTFMGHKGSVRCVSFKPENTAVFATGSRDGSLMIWDARAWKKCAKFSHHLPDQIISSGAGSPCPTAKKNSFSVELLNSRSVTGLVFQNDNTLISCGSIDKFIRIWDMRKTYSRSTSNTISKYQLASPFNSAFSYLCMNTLGTKLYANCMDHYIYCFNINSYDPDPVAAFYGHINGSFYVKSSVSFDGSYLMSGSSDESAYLWSTKTAELSEGAVKPFVVLKSHTAEVTCVEMCPDNMAVVTCADDGTFRLWNPFNVKIRETDQVDFATCYNVENVSTVKVQWKNKRKFRELEAENFENVKGDCLSHTKICRFYPVNHSSPYICHGESTQARGEKRPHEDVPNEKEIAKKRAILEMQEKTPPRSGEVKSIIAAQFGGNVPSKSASMAPVKVSSKRKLDDMPGFKEEHKLKRLNCGGILTPSNSLDGNNKNIPERLEAQDSQKRLPEPATIGSQISKKKASEAKTHLSALSSPTSNLPNYVEDGTSPYIHRCPKVVQKENDWLTKLRKSYKLPKSPEVKPLSPKGNSPAIEKRKKKSADCTLHKYFKVSSKGMEKSFNSQDLQKKNILAKVDNTMI